jgi:hypothetical protein
VVLTPRRWRQVCGKYPADDGDNKARSPGRARRKPLKPLRAGMPGETGEPTVTTLVCFLFFACEAAGALSTRHSPRPLLFGRIYLPSLGRIRAAGLRRCVAPCVVPANAGRWIHTRSATLEQRSRRECGSQGISATSLRGATATKQSSFLLRRCYGLLRWRSQWRSKQAYRVRILSDPGASSFETRRRRRSSG